VRLVYIKHPQLVLQCRAAVFPLTAPAAVTTAAAATITATATAAATAATDTTAAPHFVNDLQELSRRVFTTKHSVGTT
jgi:hypothetical protein